MRTEAHALAHPAASVPLRARITKLFATWNLLILLALLIVLFGMLGNKRLDGLTAIFLITTALCTCWKGSLLGRGPATSRKSWRRA